MTSDAQGSLSIFSAVLSLCQAVVEGNADKWDDVRRGLSAGAGGCLGGTMIDLLRRAVAWHDSHPGQRPRVKVPPAADYSDCATPTLTDLSVFGETKPLRVGATLQLLAYSDIKEGDNRVSVKATWTSSDDSVASVDSDGLVTALHAGKEAVTITAHAKSPGGQEVTASVPITVTSADSGLSESSPVKTSSPGSIPPASSSPVIPSPRTQ
ncbi:Ig-like domain-containing protein [Nocardia sp. NPDC004582]